MHLVKETWQINAPVKYVFEYFTNIEHFKKYLTEHLRKDLKDQPQQRISISYDATAPLAVGNAIEISGKQPLYKLVIIKNEPGVSLDFRIVPLAAPFLKWGEAILTCRFTGLNNQTAVTTQLESVSTPNLLWRFFIKVIAFILMLRTKSDTMRLIKQIENAARYEANHE